MSSPADWSDRVLAEFIEVSVNIIRGVIDDVAAGLRDPVSGMGRRNVAAYVLEREARKFCERLSSYVCKIQLLARTLAKLSHQTEFTRNVISQLDLAATSLEVALKRLRGEFPTVLTPADVSTFFQSVSDDVKRSIPSLENAHNAVRKRRDELASLESEIKPRGAHLVTCAVLSLVAAILTGYGLNLEFANQPQLPNSYVVILLGVLIGAAAAYLGWSFRRMTR